MTSTLTPGPSAEASSVRQLAQAQRHLQAALTIVDRLFADVGAGLAASAAYPLGEAGRAIHHALVTLGECRPDPRPL